MAMHNLTLSSVMLNSSDSVYLSDSRGVVVIIMLIICAWIILVNALVFICLLMSKKTVKTFVNVQLLSFSLTDMLVGFSAIPLSLTFYITSAFPYFCSCAGTMYVYCISQTATLFHAFGVCLHRVITTKRSSGHNDRNPENMLRIILFQIAFIWIVSILLVSVPFGLFSRFGTPLTECSLNTLFNDKYMHFIAFMDIIFFIPQFGMNIMYCYLFRFLLTTWRNMDIKQKSRGHALNNLGKDRLYHMNYLSENKRVFRDTTKEGFSEIDSDPKLVTDNNVTLDTFGKANENSEATYEFSRRNLLLRGFRSLLCVEYRKSNSEEADFEPTKSRAEDKFQESGSPDETWLKLDEHRKKSNYGEIKETCPSSRHQTHLNRNETNRDILKLKTRKPFSALNRKATKHKCLRKIGYHGQRRVFITIGIILLVVNVFMTPITFLVIMELLNGELLTRKTKIFVLVMSFMNSALNPIIYSLRIKPFRAAVAKNWNRFIFRVCLCDRKQ